MNFLKPVIACFGLALLAQAGNAHHSTNGIYDEAQEVELTGTVREWRLINPHPSLLLDVIGPDGEIQTWDVSYGGSAVTHLQRRGYTADTFKAGDEIVVRGHPARVEDAFGLLVRENPTRPDGTEIP